MTIEFKKRISILVLGLLTLMLNACNTIHGMGEDLAAGGKAISSAATSVQDGNESPKPATKQRTNDSNRRSS